MRGSQARRRLLVPSESTSGSGSAYERVYDREARPLLTVSAPTKPREQEVGRAEGGRRSAPGTTTLKQGAFKTEVAATFEAPDTSYTLWLLWVVPTVALATGNTARSFFKSVPSLMQGLFCLCAVLTCHVVRAGVFLDLVSFCIQYAEEREFAKNMKHWDLYEVPSTALSS